MSLEKMNLRDLVRELAEISTLVDEAQEAQSIHAPPEIRARGKTQFPILRKCENILSEELHRRFGFGEMAEVAIDAMEEYVLDKKCDAVHGTLADLERQEILANLFGALETEEDAKVREAAEREALGCTITDIEDAERHADAAFKVLHPEVTESLMPDEMEFHKPGECIRIPATGTFALGLPKCLQGEDHSPILWAMKQAAWSSLQRLETDVLVEYLKLWIKKHHDYGPENHAIWGCQGAIIRATDKLMRLKGHYFDGRMMLTDKTEDDWLDLIGYGLIGLVIERGKWPVTTLEEVLEAYEDEDEYEREHD